MPWWTTAKGRVDAIAPGTEDAIAPVNKSLAVVDHGERKDAIAPAFEPEEDIRVPRSFLERERE